LNSLTEQYSESNEQFDFVRHEQVAISNYLREVSFYTELANSARRIADEALKRRGIVIQVIEARAKDPASFGKKAAKPSKNDPNFPMYPEPAQQITDKAAIRIITFFPRTVREIDEVLRSEFSIIEHFDKGESLIEDERFGYQSVHYLVTLSEARTALPEYQRFKSAKVEVQVRTILQHAWAEIEHDIQYKTSATIPRDIKRRFMSLAGLLELADREFQAIQDDDRDLTERAEDLISAGELKTVEITPGALKVYLDKTLGPDGRMTEASYDWTARLLLQLGFSSLEQVDQCVSAFDDDMLCRIVDGARQGQLTRFEYTLLAGMGELFIQLHPWGAEKWYSDYMSKRLKVFKKHKIEVGGFSPASSSA